MHILVLIVSQRFLMLHLIALTTQLILSITTSTTTVCNLTSAEDVHLDCSTNPIYNNSTVDPMSAEGMRGYCSADPVNIENICDPELCDTEESIATSSDFQAKNSDVDCTIVTGVSNSSRLKNMVS